LRNEYQALALIVFVKYIRYQ